MSDAPDTEIELRRLDIRKTYLIAHVNVTDHDTGEFVGDFIVKADNHGGQQFAFGDDDVAAAGGIYMDGAHPSVGLLRYVASVVESEGGWRVRAAEYIPEGGSE